MAALPAAELSRKRGPLYQQLASVLRGAIQQGDLAIGDELPKEAEIAGKYSVSLITVRQALRDLEAAGLIRKRSAKPAVVTGVGPDSNLNWSFQNFTDMAMFTKDARLEVLDYERSDNAILRERFGLPSGEKGYRLRSILHGPGGRRTRVTTYFPPDIGSSLKKSDFKDTLIFRTVQNRLGIEVSVANVVIRADIADAEMAADLNISVGSAALVVEMLFETDDQKKIEYTVAEHPNEQFRITYKASSVGT